MTFCYVCEVFTIILRSCPKLCQKFDVFGPPYSWGISVSKHYTFYCLSEILELNTGDTISAVTDHGCVRTKIHKEQLNATGAASASGYICVFLIAAVLFHIDSWASLVTFILFQIQRVAKSKNLNINTQMCKYAYFPNSVQRTQSSG